LTGTFGYGMLNREASCLTWTWDDILQMTGSFV
jgi:hypothetical protein